MRTNTIFLINALILFFAGCQATNSPSGLAALFDAPANAPAYAYCSTSSEERQNERLQSDLTRYLADDARQYVNERVASILIVAAMRVVDTHPSLKACERTFHEGEKIFRNAFSNHRSNLETSLGEEGFEEGEIGIVQRVIRQAWIEDQSSRLAYVELLSPQSLGSAEDWAFERAKANAVLLDGQHREVIKQLLKAHHWIRRDAFGDETAARALTLIQHADADPSFQVTALDRMEPYVESGDVDGAAYANLWDRVAVNTGRLQRYGTQPQSECNADGTLSAMPIEDVAGLALRREAVGLGPLDAEMERLATDRCN